MSEQLSLFELLRSAPPAVSRPELWTPDDIFSAANQTIVQKFGEDYRVERKSAKKDPKQIADDLSSFANYSPHGGIIFIGIEDDGEVTGFSPNGSKDISEFESVGHFCPDARITTKHISVLNSAGEPDTILAVRVLYRKDKLVETHEREAFIRTGKKKRRLSEEEKREIRISKGEVDYEGEPTNLKYSTDFEKQLIKDFCDSFADKRGLAPDHSYEDILVINHMGEIEAGAFKPNLACALLFAKDPRKVIPGCRIRFQRFEGRQEGSGSNYNLVKDIFIDGPIPMMIRDAEKVVADQMRDFTRLGKDGRFYTRPEYPRDAWLESIVNAVVHRSYNLKNMNIFIKMFDDRFVVESPGGFLPPVTEETIYDFHNPRNPFLMEALFYFGFVKCAHEGTQRMREVMKECDLPPPEFHQKELGHHQVHVVLRNNIEARKNYVEAGAAKILGEKIIATLNERERMVVNFLAEHVSMNVSDGIRLLQCDWRTSKNLLERLRNKNILVRTTVTGKTRDPKAKYHLLETKK